MLIGAHVSNAGGLDRAVERGIERGCDAIQIFNQSPRMWRPTAYNEDDYAEFREALDDSPIQAVLIHAVYLLNCATEDREMREKTLASLIQSLRVGAGIGAVGVVLHPGSAKQGDVKKAIKRAGKVIKEALDETDGCPLLLEDTAGAGGTLGRSFEELAALLDAAGGGKRLGICLDSCHLFASGYDVRTAESLGGSPRRVRPHCRAAIASGRCTSTIRPSRSDPTATGTRSWARASSATRVARCSFPSPGSRSCRGVLETGRDHGSPAAEDVALAKKLRGRGKSNRTRAKRSGKSARTAGSAG